MRRNTASASFMARLGRSQSGNVIAIGAAALVPLAGLIGGGVDMSRLYLTKTRLQQACDAGALAGRKAMGSGDWTEGSATSAEGRAEELFDANFQSGAYGTDPVTRTFTEENGEVTGTAVVSVPMTIMKIFGITERTMTVTCTAKMEIPNTDVMFVLDVTGSMNCPTGASNCTNNGNVPAAGARITGLKSAVKCFYEALLRVNTAEVCGSDPTATSYSGTAQIRLGFVPYSVNVNVGKLLNNDWLADEWNYQSRVADSETVYAWTAGSEGSRSEWTQWSNPPDDITNAGSYNNWREMSGSVTVNGTRHPKSASSSSTCNALNTNGSIADYTLSQETNTTTSSDPVPPNYPASEQIVTYTDRRSRTVTAYRYVWSGFWIFASCKLEVATRETSQVRTATATRPVNWTEHQRFVQWRYKQVEHDVSALKLGGSSWSNSVALPLSTSTASVRLSGNNNLSNITVVSNTNVTWEGCVEERYTIKNSDRDPSNEWSPIPEEAYDLDIDMIPSDGTDENSYWGPMLEGAVWGRYTGNNNNNRTLNDVTPSGANPSHPARNTELYCSTEAKKLQTWYTPGGFVSYVNSLKAIGNTYHDIGMIWGARFISPTGIFADENEATPTGGSIQRHIIFMTDGGTQTGFTNYTAYGIPWWDRRQTTYVPSNANLDDIVNSRLDGLCTEIKNRNITLWVVSYGGGVDTDTEDRLEDCATPGKYFKADDTPTLISNFKQIASEIAALRLTE